MSDELIVPLSTVVEACKKANERFRAPQVPELVTAFVQAYCENKAMESAVHDRGQREQRD